MRRPAVPMNVLMQAGGMTVRDLLLCLCELFQLPWIVEPRVGANFVACGEKFEGSD